MCGAPGIPEQSQAQAWSKFETILKTTGFENAFLLSMEIFLFQKITGYDLQYTALVGKPSEITYRYAEHVITMQAKKMGFKEPIMKLYFIG